MTAAELLRRFKRVDLTRLTADALEKNEESVVEINRRQMNRGETRLGTEIKPPYTRLTLEIKREKGQPTDYVTLRDTGAFQRAMYLRVTGDKLEISSSDPKTLELTEKYGDDIFGVAGESQGATWGIVREEVVRGVKQITGLP